MKTFIISAQHLPRFVHPSDAHSCINTRLKKPGPKKPYISPIQYLNQTIIPHHTVAVMSFFRQMKGLMGRNLCPWTNKKTYPSANGTVQVWNESHDLSNTHSQIQTHTSLLVWVKLPFNLNTAEILLKENQFLREAIHLSV